MLTSGKPLHNYGKSPFLMEKLSISMAIFNSYVSHYQRVDHSPRVSPWFQHIFFPISTGVNAHTCSMYGIFTNIDPMDDPM